LFLLFTNFSFIDNVICTYARGHTVIGAL